MSGTRYYPFSAADRLGVVPLGPLMAKILNSSLSLSNVNSSGSYCFKSFIFMRAVIVRFLSE